MIGRSMSEHGVIDVLLFPSSWKSKERRVLFRDKFPFLMLCHVPLPSSWEEWYMQRKHVFWGGVFYFFPVDVCGNSGFLSAESSEKALSLTH